MKRIIKLKKIKKTSDIKIKKTFRKKRNNKRNFLCKNIYQIESPHNNNEYLINNCSSPFFGDEEEEDSMGMNMNSFICFDNTNPELDPFGFKEIELL